MDVLRVSPQANDFFVMTLQLQQYFEVQRAAWADEGGGVCIAHFAGVRAENESVSGITRLSCGSVEVDVHEFRSATSPDPVPRKSCGLPLAASLP
jgi:hypothetical protein